MNSFTSKLPNAGTTIFSVMSAMAREHNAINLSQGFPDFAVSPQLIDLIHHYMKTGHNQYAPMQGVVKLREMIAHKATQSYGHAVNPDTEVTVTAGATEAIFATIMALIKPNDEVIVLEPAYDCYTPSIELAGGKAVPLPLNQPDFSINWPFIRTAMTKQTRMLMINSPHNPSGAVITAADLQELKSLLEDFPNLLVLSDEVYEHIIFDGIRHQSILQDEFIKNRSVAIFSFGKTFHATGWKIGYTIAPDWISAEIRKMHQYITFSVNTPVQLALADFLETPENYQSLPDFYQEKRDEFLKQIEDSAFRPISCSGTYFQLLSYADIADEPDVKMAEILTKKHGLATIPISVFYSDKKDDRILRFCFAKGKETLAKAGEILRNLKLTK